jgi:prepilin-type N-terminal cleavage/methylation domain-containing protein
VEKLKKHAFFTFSQRGYTLIEIIVVVTAISIFMIAGVVSYVNFTKNAHDARRKQDLVTLRHAIEVYKAANPAHCYPDAPLYPSLIIGGYINKELKDPKTDITYDYTPSGGACPNSYTLETSLSDGTIYKANPYGNQ